jgi:alcohol dehydrogenase class IV
MKNEKQKPSLKFELPTSWRHGIGMSSQIADILLEYDCHRPLLVTDKLLVSLGVIKPVTHSLSQSDISFTICDAVDKEPTVNLFEFITGILDLESFDSVIAVGGGSVMDVSKGLAVIGTFGGSITNYDGFDKFPAKPHMKIFAIPTTAGTGSEVSDGVVVIDEQRNTKFVVISRYLRPEVALTDPEMTKSMPPKVTACTGVDALIHAIEAYLSTGSNMATDLFALKAIGLIAEGLESAYNDGGNLKVREKMQIGATMAMIAASNTHVGMCHAMDGPISAFYHIPHGQACGLVSPAVLKFNSLVVKEKVSNIFKVMGLVTVDTEDSEAIEVGCNKLTELLDRIGLLIRLRDIGYKESHMETMVKETLKSAQLGTNPRQPTEKEVESILRQII